MVPTITYPRLEVELESNERLDKVTISVCRMYGSKSHYGDTPLTSPLADPIVLDAFPQPECRAIVALGAPLDWVIQGLRIRRAIGIVALNAYNGAATPDERDAVIDAQLAQENWGAISSEDFNWYITFVLQYTVSVSSDDIERRRHFWLKTTKSMELNQKYRTDASKYLNVLEAYGSTVIEPLFFANLVVRDVPLFTAPTREPFGVPEWTAHAPSISRRGGPSNLDGVADRFTEMASVPFKRHDWLTSASYWYCMATTENDPWKKFLWSFLALEIIVNKLFPKLFEEVTRKLRDTGIPFENTGFLSTLFRDRGSVPLETKFGLVALKLSPTTVDEDLSEFSRAKKARNGMAHGQLRNDDELPLNSIRQLLEKYLKLIADHELGS